MEKEKNIINNWLEQHGDPETDRFVDKNVEIVDKILVVLKERNLSKADFAKLLGKKPSEVSRWLTGMHNLTLKSIVKMETALGIDLIYTKPQIQHEYHFIEIPAEQAGLSEDAPDYEPGSEQQQSEYELAM